MAPYKCKFCHVELLENTYTCRNCDIRHRDYNPLITWMSLFFVVLVGVMAIADQKGYIPLTPINESIAKNLEMQSEILNNKSLIEQKRQSIHQN